MLKKDLIFEVKSSNDDNKTIEGVFSTSDVDRSGDPPIEQESWNLKNFKKNPVVLFAHESHNIPVGKVTKLKLNEKGNLAGKIMFAIDEGVGVYGDLIKTIYNLYKGKYMNAFSVGFMRGNIVDDKKGMKMTNNELLEISCVPVPANALALAQSKGLNIDVLKEIDKIEDSIDFNAKGEKLDDESDESNEISDDKEKEDEDTSGEEEIITEDENEEEEENEEENEDILNLSIDQEKKEIRVKDKDGNDLGSVEITDELKNLFIEDKTVVTESSKELKEKSQKNEIKTLNKIIRTLLVEKQKVRSN